MSATWPRRCPCSGPSRSASRPISTTARCASSTVVERLADARAGPRRRARSPRCSTISTPAAASPCSSSPPARCGSASRRGSPRSRWPQAFGLDVDAVEEVWHGIGPPYLPLFAWAEGARRAADRRGRAGLPPVHARPSARGAAGLARRLCRRVEMGRDPRPARPRRRRDPALQPRRRRHHPQLPRRRRGLRGRGRARRRIAGQGRVPGRRAWRRRGELQRAPAAARPQDRLGEDARRLSRLRPALRHLVRRRRRICARCRWTERRARLEAFVAAARSRPLRPLGADRGGQTSRRWRRSAPAPATPRSRA